jgi:O-antigen/teichoic acid export membrane protein
VSAHALPTQCEVARSALRRHPVRKLIAQTACFNVASTATAALGGVVMARAVGPTIRGEYAAVTAWFGFLLIFGEAGQSAAICFFVARDSRHAPGYVATSRAMMLVTGTVTLLAAIAVAPVLAHGYPGVATAYRTAFAGSIIAIASCSYIFALQARTTERWNVARLSQPLLAMAGIILLWRLRLLTLNTAIDTMIVAMAVQFGYSYYWCRRTKLAPGRAQAKWVRPLGAYGLSQLAAITPAAVNLYLDQLVLSQMVPPADLGRYAIAASISLIPVPLVAAIGNVAFPRLAAQGQVLADSRRLRLTALLASAVAASAIMLPVAVGGYWLIPLVFGPAYRGAAPLLWLLAPGGVFLACGQVAGDLLRGLNRPGFVAAAQGLAAVFTVILLIVLLPGLGVAAAGVATSVAYGVALIVMIRYLWRPRHADQPTSRQTTEEGLCVSESSGRLGRTPLRRTL